VVVLGERSQPAGEPSASAWWRRLPARRLARQVARSMPAGGLWAGASSGRPAWGPLPERPERLLPAGLARLASAREPIPGPALTVDWEEFQGSDRARPFRPEPTRVGST
jgi:hypothetical protein